MGAIHDEVRAWLHRQADWIQEAADRLLKKGRLDRSDIADLHALIKTEAGRVVTKTRPFHELLKDVTAGSDVRLRSISQVKGIENLSPAHPLLFGDGNLTVVYGHNGSGKSGYTRLLKRASGKPRAQLLYANVFEAVPAEQKCQIEYSSQGKLESSEWHADGAPIDALISLDVFDSDEAAFYLRSESSASYTPPLVAMFVALAAACDDVKRLLEEDQDRDVSALPAAPAEYAGSAAILSYNSLKPTLDAKALDAIVRWSDDDAAQLRSLGERLNASDPAGLAQAKRNAELATRRIVDKIFQAGVAYNVDALAAIRGLRQSADIARRAAVDAARVNSAKLDGVGEDSWRALWRAARAYSQLPYPDRDFPVTEDARCVLCHQPLDEEAAHRLQEFEAFVQGAVEAAAERAETSYQGALNALPEPAQVEFYRAQLQSAGLTDPGWDAYLDAYWKAIAVTRQALIAHELTEAAQPAPDSQDACAKLTFFAKKLEAEALQLDKDAKDFDRGLAKRQKTALEGKFWVCQQAEAVRNEISRLKRVDALDKLKAFASSRPVTAQAGVVAEQAITQAYVARFNAELNKLGAGRIQVELVKSKMEKGSAKHRLQLKSAKGKQPLEQVLSEGERRIIALAAFLADVGEKPTPAPFIFDDPISSLDHDYEWAVAKRLGELAKTRQVIVFTHRLSFYGAMEDVAKKVGEPVKGKGFFQTCIETYAGKAGQPAHQATWNANTTAANNLLIERLNAAARAGQEGGGNEYRVRAQGICSDFRKLLERTVEDDLIYAIVKRHRRSVTTENKLAALPIIEAADCDLIDRLMTKYSFYEHSQSDEVPVPIPEEKELRADLEELRLWRKGFVERRKAVLA
ncbi:hypothetical protein CAL26_10495 [Bordetella genomosp. 9]|uniref:Protein CR006 P-loop domain-containing protein n=1 Tax=Bordetella genomosp. 9 TaxID=1416803 RepID=A0A261RFM7_9BORD|nr:AAA family ATPase [Bordetella genomosp. 9]OZI23836.1 hypothetical protein CAL26_10495 [Bordetella genomosp. 9]